MVVETLELLKAGRAAQTQYHFKTQAVTVAAIGLADLPLEGWCFNSKNDQIYLAIAPQLLQLIALFITALWCHFNPYMQSFIQISISGKVLYRQLRLPVVVRGHKLLRTGRER